MLGNVWFRVGAGGADWRGAGTFEDGDEMAVRREGLTVGAGEGAARGGIRCALGAGLASGLVPRAP